MSRSAIVNTVARFAIAVLVGLLSAVSGDQAEAQDRKASPPKTENGPPFAFLCLASDRVPDSDELKRQLEKWLGADDSKPLTELVVDTKKTLTVSFDFDGNSFVAGLIPKPIPKPDIDYACANAFFWPEAGEAMKRHTDHLIVTALGDYEKPWHRALALSQVMAACIEAFDSVGVYWGHASVVHSPEFFLQGMREAGTEITNLPVELWTGFLRTYRDDKTVDMYTDGLDVFGCMEFEIVASKQNMSDVFEMLMGMSRYVIFHGNVIADGDTVGGEAEEKIKTHFEKSVIGRETRVIRIDY